MKNYEDKIYSLGETVTGQTQAMSQAVQKTLENNGGVGIMTGSYDQNLSILSVNNLLLHSTGHTFDTFMEQTKGSLKNFFYNEEDILDRDRFLQLHGAGEAQILTADDIVNNVRLYKEDATDEAGRQIWVMSVQVNWDHVNLALLNEAIYSGFWYFDCDENSEIVNANWSHEFRKMLGYHDTLDFPNKLESWSDLLHPQDKERVMVQLQAAIKDKTNQIKYQVEYRMRMKDNQYQWFRASAEVIRRLDGSASRIAGIFINIDAEKKEIMQAQKSAAFHRAFTKALDWKMPDMDGIETARQIRKRIGKEITIIVLTSYEFSEIEEEAKAAGIDAFIAKPLFRSRLTATLRQFTSGRKEKTARNYLEKLSESDYTGKRILLVEDNELNREIAGEILQMTGAKVETAENGKIAVEKVEASPKGLYDLVFMDIQMPVMNGYEATAAIRSLPGEKGKLPIVAMTANAFAEDVQLAKNTGMNGHIAKPLDMNKLNDVLESWL